MKHLSRMVWKEWSECRVFLWIGLGVFLGLPIIGGLEGMAQYSHRYEIFTSPWVTTLGGFFLLVAVAATCRDLSDGVEQFWRSRPVGVVRWFLVKYLVGLTVP